MTSCVENQADLRCQEPSDQNQKNTKRTRYTIYDQHTVCTDNITYNIHIQRTTYNHGIAYNVQGPEYNVQRIQGL